MHSIKQSLRYGGVEQISPAEKWLVMNVIFFSESNKIRRNLRGM